MVEVARASLVAALLLAPGLATAQLAECAGLGGATDAYKIVVDDLDMSAVPEAAKAELQKLKQRISFTLSAQFQEFQSDVAGQKLNPSVGLGVVNCLNRKPSQTGDDFTKDRVRLLNDKRVVVELWGVLLPGDSDSSAGHAMIGYVIPPVISYLSDPAVPGMHFIQYPKPGQTAGNSLEKLPEASAFAMLGLALKAQKAKKYDLAIWAFSRSAGSILQMQKSGEPAAMEKLLGYIRTAQCETRESARKDTSYTGTLTVTPRETCGAAT
jgi:hypothetical protein